MNPIKTTYRTLLRETAALFYRAGIEEADNDAALLVMHCFGIDKNRLFLDLDRNLSDSPKELPAILSRLREGAMRRSRRIPLDYILGEKYFYGRPFAVDEGVLIPRFDTEVLVERVLAENRDPSVSVLDLCTGSGCIGITLKLSGGYRQVEASDFSSHALSTARKNARLLQAPVTLIESDLFEKLRGPYDIIVCNPPYIGQREFQTLMPEMPIFEPAAALLAPEEGMGIYRRIRESFEAYLHPAGRLYLEIGAGQRREIEKLFSGLHLSFGRDLNGLDRTVRIER